MFLCALIFACTHGTTVVCTCAHTVPAVTQCSSLWIVCPVIVYLRSVMLECTCIQDYMYVIISDVFCVCVWGGGGAGKNMLCLQRFNMATTCSPILWDVHFS